MLNRLARPGALTRTPALLFQRARYPNARQDPFHDLPPSEGIDARRREFIIQPKGEPSIVEKAEGMYWEYSHLMFRGALVLLFSAYMYYRYVDPSYDIWTRFKI